MNCYGPLLCQQLGLGRGVAQGCVLSRILSGLCSLLFAESRKQLSWIIVTGC